MGTPGKVPCRVLRNWTMERLSMPESMSGMSCSMSSTCSRSRATRRTLPVSISRLGPAKAAGAPGDAEAAPGSASCASGGAAAGAAAGGRAVQRLIVCGGSFASLPAGSMKGALGEADAFFARLAASMRVEVMPGRGDPTSLSLPQLPLHPHLFKQVRECRNFRSVTNPYECQLDGVNVLGHSGQPVEDLLRCTQLGSPLEALATCLGVSHLAPTAPDTLETQPFTVGDPFVMGEVPHVLFSGCHERAEHQWQASSRGEGGTLCVCVPAFCRQPALVLVNLRNPRDVHVQLFGDAGAGGATESKTEA
mmetsp:Transcript_44631/g.142246  ORF Transcript_44631/g.142246 Transcript_44631/m.142246 type:complete len:307 (-) Transcript_44631:340-1260(-)